MDEKKHSPKSNIKERRNEILEYLLNFGGFGIPAGTKKELAEKWECDYRTIDRDIDYMISHIKVPKMIKLGQKFLIGYEKMMKVAAQFLQDENPELRIKGMAAYNQNQSNFTKMCEKYGFKEVIADKIELEGNLNYNNLTKEECDELIKRTLGR